MTEQKPSVGRIVHYVSYGTPIRSDGSQAYTQKCRAAIITAVRHDADVTEDGVPVLDLCVLNPTGMFFTRECAHHGGDTGHDGSGTEIPTKSYQGGTWHWPERV